MVCKINNKKVVEWSIGGKHINQIYTHMYGKYEYTGEIKLDFDSKNSSSVVSNPGKEWGAIKPYALVKWHTCSINSYFINNTVWGWPFAAHIRSSLIWGLRGTECYILSSVDGIYTVQINPCVITSLLNVDKMVRKKDYPNIKVSDADWGNFLRGFVIQTIELYFTSAHIFAYAQFLKKYQHITAYDFVKFANIFTISNIFEETPMSNCTPIGCNKVPYYDFKTLGATSLENYISMHFSDVSAYKVDTNGYSFELELNYLDVLKNGGLQLLKNLSLGTDCNIPSKSWHTTNIFKIQLFESEVYFRDEWRDYFSLDLDEKVEFIVAKRKKNSPVDIRLKADKITFSTFYDLTGECNHESLAKHMKSYSIGSKKRGSKKRMAKKKSNNYHEMI